MDFPAFIVVDDKGNDFFAVSTLKVIPSGSRIDHSRVAHSIMEGPRHCCALALVKEYVHHAMAQDRSACSHGGALWPQGLHINGKPGCCGKNVDNHWTGLVT